mmetsp:Transcript_33316/g.60393  ORF Transcript_33316/g.60393 Transcript_33316/m.60393 type:complete len:249 (+) Transcript_33316:26-772(+)|eukprot:CAMPEP_0197625134 /NCGR_PEP_ID=MMETSP1338-20131121/4574_1 /TAXON_ID=43686 ORGANISM="Pelagodinium beii, Strain RCC1491" /NCGR_SAMPLE_ID=MMETSP1338 /ASSEMBLY_ACC=CAM_ASM_000754 /LENGTH=248 /DNA_ID=CAMNT_0043195453 /DNA_START=53 /DNA_END=799 /DNA_ORIENTATION=-
MVSFAAPPISRSGDHRIGSELSRTSLPELCVDAFQTDGFLNIVKRVALHYNVRCACIGLHRMDGMVLKARVGIKQKWLPCTDTGGGKCMCDHHIQRDLPIIIEDTTKCQRVLQDPLVTSHPHARFFAESPLVIDSGDYCCFGTLCIMDPAPRNFSVNECDVLSNAAKEIVELLTESFQQDSLKLRTAPELTMGSLSSLTSQSLVTLPELMERNMDEVNAAGYAHLGERPQEADVRDSQDLSSESDAGE